MLRNFIKLAWRNLWKNRLFSAINILGLSTGLAFILIIGAYIWSEFKVNSSISADVYIIQSKWKKADMGLEFTSLAPLGKALKDNYPALVKSYYRHDGLSTIVSKGDKHFTEQIQNGDATLLTMFGFELLHGDAGTAMSQPNSMVITAAKALKYFGRTNVVGETLTLNSFNNTKQDFEITGVLKNLPQNTVTNFGGGTNEIFLPVASFKFFGREAGLDAWTNPYMVNYIELQHGVKPEQLQQPIKQLMSSNAPADIVANMTPYLARVNDYYLQQDNGKAGKMIWTLACIGGFILLMAVINFINISIGSSVSRLKEIGVRKVMGGSRGSLVIQFLTESVLLALISFIMAIGVYWLSRSFFSEVMGKQIPRLSELPLYFVLIPIPIILLTGLLGGLYPAVVLSAQSSIDSLKGKLRSVKENVTFRHSLIVVQFVTAIIVFVAAVVINKQVAFFFDTDLGYNKEQVITAKVPRDWSAEGVRHMETMRNEFLRMPEIADASFSFEIPDGQAGNSNNNIYRPSQDSTSAISAVSLMTDEHFASTYKIPLVAGGFFPSHGEGTDAGSIVLNETAAKSLGWQNPAAAVGQFIRVQGSPAPLRVGGVVGDFHFGSMHKQIGPLYFYHVKTTPYYRYLSFKLKPGQVAANINALQQKWASLFPGSPFEYVFLDDTLGRLYKTELQMKKASQAATAVAILVVVLGVLSITTLSIVRRVKEVGIRKVLGASSVQVVWLFMQEFSKLALIANLVAWPLAYWALHNWLNNYAYKIQLTLTPFMMVTLAMAALIALVVTLRSLSAALSNPVKSISNR